MKHTPEHNHFADGIFRGVGSYDPCKRCIMEHAAPDMLEALKWADKFYQDNFEIMPVAWQGVADAISAAIKRAEGE